jgi:peptide/nickel transport system substrate-binding protein
MSLRPGLAEAWHSPDALTWVFTLRSSVLFHDGAVLTPAHVVASFERARSEYPWVRGELEAVTDLRVQGEHEVVFKTRVPLNGLPSRLTYLFVTGAPSATESASGTGPYSIRSWEPSGRTVLEAFSAYHGARASIRFVEFVTIPGGHERARELERGHVNLIGDAQPDDMARLKATSGIRTLVVPGLRTVFVGVDCARPKSPYIGPPGNPFRDRRVRQGIALAIDREALVTGPLRGFADPANQIPTPHEVGFVSLLEGTPSDPVRARRLLSEAVPGGFDVQLDYSPGKYLAIDGVVQMLLAQLADVGVRVHPQAFTASGLVNRIESGNTSFFLLGWRNESGSAEESYFSLLHSRVRGAGAVNGVGYSNPEFDRLLEAASAEMDYGKGVELLRHATEIVNAELPIIPLYREKDLYAFSSNLLFETQLNPRIPIARMRFAEQ